MNQASILNPSLIQPFILRWRLSQKAMLVLGLGLIAALVVLYLSQVNGVTQLSFALANCEKEIGEVAKENKALETNFSGMSSLSGLEKLVQNLNYEPVGRVNYIQMMAVTALAK
jgi:hypothetical protein